LFFFCVYIGYGVLFKSRDFFDMTTIIFVFVVYGFIGVQRQINALIELIGEDKLRKLNNCEEEKL